MLGRELRQGQTGSQDFVSHLQSLDASRSQPTPTGGPQDAANEELTRRCESANRYFLDSRLAFGLEGLSFSNGPLILGALQRGVIPQTALRLSDGLP